MYCDRCYQRKWSQARARVPSRIICMRSLAAYSLTCLAVTLTIGFQANRGPEGRREPQKRLFIAGDDSGYLEPSVCTACHRRIDETFRRTGMGRSFYRRGAQNTVEDYSGKNTYYHEASNQHFTMSQRGGRFYQRRHQIGSDGREVNVIE